MLLTRNGLDNERAVVERCYRLFHPAQRLGDVHRHFQDEVDPVPLEQRVLLLVQDDDDVPRLEAGLLVALAAEGDLLPVLHALVDVDLEDFSLPIDLAAVALLAAQLGVDPLTLTLALAAHGLDLLHHPGSKLLNTDLHTSTPTIRTALDCSLLATNT